jgi:hypothetical protein
MKLLYVPRINVVEDITAHRLYLLFVRKRHTKRRLTADYPKTRTNVMHCNSVA